MGQSTTLFGAVLLQAISLQRKQDPHSSQEQMEPSQDVCEMVTLFIRYALQRMIGVLQALVNKHKCTLHSIAHHALSRSANCIGIRTVDVEHCLDQTGKMTVARTLLCA